jgi:hypothetical protein
MLPHFPRRTIHLDFHTGPDIPDVGKDFDAEEFARTMAEARIDSVTVFASCHHGHLYYDTDRPERHPGLPKSLDLLGEQIEALHRHGIRAPVYMSVQVNEYAANVNPGWIAVDPDGRQVKRGGPLGAGWHVLDMSSPYQDFLAEQIDEVLRKYGPLDGLFLDMCWDQVSVSRWAIDGIHRMGLDPREDGDRHRYARAVAHGYMARFKQMVDDAHREHGPVGIWFNSRPKTNLHEERKFLRHIEVEALPTGGWGYAYFPYTARFVRPLNLPTLSHTARFHKSWADFGGLKPEAALLYECSLILSQGMTNGIGDQLHPRGVLEKPAYDLIGRVYHHIEACEPWVHGGRLLSQIAVIIDPDLGDRPGPAGLGIIRSLQQLRHQFDLLPSTADLTAYPLVIVPEMVAVDTALADKLRAYLQAGGALIVSGSAALDGNGAPILSELGIATHGDSPFTVSYLRVGEQMSKRPMGSMGQRIPDMDHVMYEQGFRMSAAEGSEVLCRVVEPYFERNYRHFSSHFQTPPDKLSPYAAIIQCGRAITFAVPIFTAYGRHGNLSYRDILDNCIERLLPQPLIRDDGPSHLETTVVRKGGNVIVHLISFSVVRRTQDLDIVEDAIPLVDMPLAVRVDQEPVRVLLEPAGRELEFTFQDGYVHTAVSVLEGHAMVVFEGGLEEAHDV